MQENLIRYPRATEKYTLERDTSGERPKIGVFICECGGGISNVLNVPEITEYAKTLSDVIWAEQIRFPCFLNAENHIREAIRSNGLDRIIIGGCSPHICRSLFQDIIRKEGLNPCLLEMVNLREHCAWIHSGSEQSTQKAKDMVRMAVAKLQLSDPLERGTVAVVNTEICDGCGFCESICEFKAISIRKSDDGLKRAIVDQDLCTGCGACAGICPSGAMDQYGFSNAQILSMIDNLFDDNLSQYVNGCFEPKILVFCCHWCSYPAMDTAGKKGLQMPCNFRIIRVMCSGRIDPEFLLYAIMRGIDGILVTGGHPDDCHYISGNNRTRRKVALLRNAIEQYGLDKKRILIEWIGPDEGKKFQKIITDFTNNIRELGPNPVGDRIV